MIAIVSRGIYAFIETREKTQILTLDAKKKIIWNITAKNGSISFITAQPQVTDRILRTGKYRLYQVKDELTLTSGTHLELLTGRGVWQGYVLPQGLPKNNKSLYPLFTVAEIITKSH